MVISRRLVGGPLCERRIAARCHPGGAIPVNGHRASVNEDGSMVSLEVSMRLCAFYLVCLFRRSVTSAYAFFTSGHVFLLNAWKVSTLSSLMSSLLAPSYHVYRSLSIHETP
jgi:hypothetical protein